MLHLALFVTLSCTAPRYEELPDPNGAACSTENPNRAERVAALRLYRALCNVYPSPEVFQRSVPCVAGQLVTFDAGTVCATWWVTAVDSAGNESRLRCAPSYTVGVPSVGVGLEEAQRYSRTVYDIAGRKFLAAEAPPGIYFEKRGGNCVPRIYDDCIRRVVILK